MPFYWESEKGNKVLVWNGEHYHFGNEFGIVKTATGSYVHKDELRDSFTQDKLKNMGIKSYMFTGDRLSFAKMVASSIGVHEYKAELLPDEKFKELTSLQKSHKVIFVGDGINDTPSLVLADVGISMGNIGSSSAIEASDIVIMNDDLQGILNVIQIAYKTKRIILSNLVFSIGH